MRVSAPGECLLRLAKRSLQSKRLPRWSSLPSPSFLSLKTYISSLVADVGCLSLPKPPGWVLFPPRSDIQPRVCMDPRTTRSSDVVFTVQSFYSRGLLVPISRLSF